MASIQNNNILFVVVHFLPPSIVYSIPFPLSIIVALILSKWVCHLLASSVFFFLFACYNFWILNRFLFICFDFFLFFFMLNNYICCGTYMHLLIYLGKKKTEKLLPRTQNKH